MNPTRELVTIDNGIPTTTSIEIAKNFNKEHKNVIRDIKNLGCSIEFNRLNFEPISYYDHRNRQQPMYNITKNGFVFLCMGFSGSKADKFKEKYIEAFDKMELALKRLEFEKMSIQNIPKKDIKKYIQKEISEQLSKNFVQKKINTESEEKIFYSKTDPILMAADKLSNHLNQSHNYEIERLNIIIYNMLELDPSNPRQKISQSTLANLSGVSNKTIYRYTKPLIGLRLITSCRGYKLNNKLIQLRDYIKSLPEFHKHSKLKIYFSDDYMNGI